MNAETRYKGKQPALLIVPNLGTKRGWIRKLERKFPFSSKYIFRVYTPNAKLEHQIGKLPTKFQQVFIVNDPLNGDYSDILKGIRRKNLHCIGLHIFKKRPITSVFAHELKNWNEVIAGKLNRQ